MSETAKIENDIQDQDNDQNMDDILASIRRIISDDDTKTIEGAPKEEAELDAADSVDIMESDALESDIMEGLSEDHPLSKDKEDVAESMDTAVAADVTETSDDLSSDAQASNNEEEMGKIEDVEDAEAVAPQEVVETSADETSGHASVDEDDSAESAAADSGDILELSEADIIDETADADQEQVDEASQADSVSESDDAGPEIVSADDIDFDDPEDDASALNEAELAVEDPVEDQETVLESPMDEVIMDAPQEDLQDSMSATATSDASLDTQLISEAASDSVMNSFKNLASIQMNNAADTSLEDVVIELMRPMIKEWMDNHLPPLVDRLVREEIKRLADSKNSS